MNSRLHFKDKIKNTAIFLICVLSLLILVSCESRHLKGEAEAIRITKTIVGRDGAEMVLIPAGEFLMGSKCYTKYQQGRFRIFPLNYTKPVHAVYLDAFYMDKYEVTNAQFKRFLQANPQWRKGSRLDRRYQHRDYLRDWDGMDYPAGKANHAVVYVSWYAAAAYAQWAGKRLPTEAEWEKAARGGLVGKEYPWGNEITADNANYIYKGEGYRPGLHEAMGKRDKWDFTAPVGSFPPNGYGLYDMAGNVWEWCADEFDPDYYSKSQKHNPKGPGAVTTFRKMDFMNVTSRRVLRGGSWFNYTISLRCANRCNGVPQFADFSTGFRCASVHLEHPDLSRPDSRDRPRRGEDGEGTVREESLRPRESHPQALDQSKQVVALDSGNAEVHKAEAEATSIPKTIVGKDGVEMVLIPAGEFLMGSDDFSGYDRYTTPVHTVYVDAFYMDKYPVTNAQFRQFLQANPQWKKGRSMDRRYNHFLPRSHYLKHWDGMNCPEGTADHPIYRVSWYAAAAYAQWAGKRLPTEAEWEKAARGGLVGKKYPWGNKLNRAYANSAGTGGRDKWDFTSPVGFFLPNGYGLYDMAGNVFEWCADEYDYYSFLKRPKDNSKGLGDVITSESRNFMNIKSARVVRGSHCWAFGLTLHCGFRFGTPPGSSHYSFGFRCVQDP